jgi:hypothetical protein
MKIYLALMISLTQLARGVVSLKFTTVVRKNSFRKALLSCSATTSNPSAAEFLDEAILMEGCIFFYHSHIFFVYPINLQLMIRHREIWLWPRK